MAEPVTIVDKDVLKVLSVDTRVDILKELSQGSRTPSDLGKRLRKSDSTIVEHLDALAKAGLVKKVEEPGKKWVFYTLTDRGYGVMNTKSRRLIIILGTSLVTIAGGIYNLGIYSQNFFTDFGNAGAAKSAPTPLAEIASDVTSSALPAAASAAPAISPFYLYAALGLIAAGSVGLALFMLKRLNKV